jgi:3-hydroxybutyryl-CoA dehydrogenase
MEIKTIGVVGAGQMGAGIAQVAAAVGVTVLLADIDLSAAQKGLAGIVASGWVAMVEKAKITAERARRHVARLTAGGGPGRPRRRRPRHRGGHRERGAQEAHLRGSPQDLPRRHLLATNTSSIPITRIAAATGRSGPGHRHALHEPRAGDEAGGDHPRPRHQRCHLCDGHAPSAQRMGKTTVLSRDMPGFIVNRVLMPMINEAVVALYEGIGTVEDIDTGMKLGTNQPMGPLTLADFIGLDTCLAIMEVLHQGTGDSKYRPCPLLRQYVDAGWLGQEEWPRLL